MSRAKHVTRRRRALAAVAALAALAGAIAGSGSRDEGRQEHAAEPTFCESPSPDALARAAGQLLITRMEVPTDSRTLRRARGGRIGGVILFPAPGTRPAAVAAAIGRVQRAAERGGHPALLVTIDQEGGPVKRLPDLAPERGPAELAGGPTASARREGAATGVDLRAVGVNVNLAPVLDVPVAPEQFMAARAFGFSPGSVARLGVAFAAGQRSAGVAATAKHFPGLGAASENTDVAPVAVAAPAARLERSLAPFRAAVEAGTEIVMMSSATYPALDGAQPAVLSPEIVHGLLRERLGYEGVVISDDLLAPGIAATHSPEAAAPAAAAAGVDLLLYAGGSAPSPQALARAVREGALGEGVVRAACGRVLELKEELAR